jgi:hypothetical protein
MTYLAEAKLLGPDGPIGLDLIAVPLKITIMT